LMNERRFKRIEIAYALNPRNAKQGAQAPPVCFTH
jgi:hypothetical protein